ncbi:MAG: hypothetical protein AB1600_04575, partial [Bacteroidota bacterium]
MKTLVLLFACSAVFVVTGLATVPSSSTGTIPEHLRSQVAKIQKEYSTGYWAEKFARKAALSKMGFVDAAAAAETVNAPVLMGTYSNSTERYSPQTFQQLLFDGPNPTGTMTKFYLENSY